jgi:hypothetical protein
MTTFIGVCLAIIAIELAILIAGLLMAAMHISRAARAIETLAYRIEENVQHVGDGLRSGWMKTLGIAARMAGGFWSGRKDREQD